MPPPAIRIPLPDRDVATAYTATSEIKCTHMGLTTTKYL